MEHEDETEQRPAPETPQNVWQSHPQQEELGMEMSLTTDQLCAKARYRERENIWGQWIAAAACLGFGAMFVYRAITGEQVWLRLGSAWMAVLVTLALWGTVRMGARTIQTGESCAQFMVRELEGSRRTLLGIQWGIILVLPSLLMYLWGGHGAAQASRLHLDPSSWRYYFLTSPWPIVAVVLVLLTGWVSLGLEAKRRARQAEELRRAMAARG